MPDPVATSTLLSLIALHQQANTHAAALNWLMREVSALRSVVKAFDPTASDVLAQKRKEIDPIIAALAEQISEMRSANEQMIEGLKSMQKTLDV